MKTMPQLIAATLIVISTGGLMAQAPQLNVQFGYWEMTTTIQLGGGAVDTSRMTAQEKARVEAMMQAMTKPQTISDKDCLTREQFTKDGLLMGQKDDGSCTQTITTNTPTLIEGTIVCTGATPMSGKVRIEAPNPTTLIGSVQSTGPTGGGGGRPYLMSATMNGKFISATCPKE